MSALRRKVAVGVKWSTISQFGRISLQLITTIILARLLPPSDFGLLGMAMVIIAFIDIFKDLGTTAGIIQKKEITDTLLSSIFWVNAGFGLFAMVVLFSCATLGGMFYQEPRVIPVLQVLSVNFFVSGLSILQQALLERSLNFKSLALTELGANFLGAVIGIVLAILNAGVWSLVFQSFTTVLLTTVWLWRFSSWRPSWIFDWNEIWSISSFSMYLVGFNVFNYFSRNADYLLIGRYLGAQELGYYTLAYRILLLPIQSISNVIRRVVFPVYSSIQDDNQRFSIAYLKVASTIALFTFPMMLGAFALARPFIIVFFGEKWESSIPLVMVLSLVGLTQSVGTMVGTIYQAKGRTDRMFYWGLTAGTAVVLAFAIGLQWGVLGVAVSYMVATFSLTYFNHAIPFRLIGLSFGKLLGVIQKAFTNGLIMLLTILVFGHYFAYRLQNELFLVLSVVIGLLVYALMNFLTNRGQLQDLWLLMKHKEKLA